MTRPARPRGPARTSHSDRPSTIDFFGYPESPRATCLLHAVHGGSDTAGGAPWHATDVRNINQSWQVTSIGRPRLNFALEVMPIAGEDAELTYSLTLLTVTLSTCHWDTSSRYRTAAHRSTRKITQGSAAPATVLTVHAAPTVHANETATRSQIATATTIGNHPGVSRAA